MRRVLFLATTTGYQTRAFGEAAERIGAGLVFGTDRCDILEDPWQDRAIPIRFYDEERSVRAILEATRFAPVDGVLVIGDRPAVIGARVMQALGLPGHPPEAVAIAGHKQHMRERLRAAGLLVPWFVPTTIAADPRPLAASVRYPCVVKPVALSGSRGVMRADDPDGFVTAFERLGTLMRSPEVRAERREAHELALVESYIAGREYALEGLLHDGVMRVLALFDKPDPLDGPFFEETIYVTPSTASPGVQTAIRDAVARTADAIGLRHGPIHSECRVCDTGIFVLEVAARPIGGLCARALRFRAATPLVSEGGTEDAEERVTSLCSLEEILLRHALGESPEGWMRESRPSGVMMIPIPRRGLLRRVDEIDAARAVSGVVAVRITAKADQLLVPLPEGASYLGFIFAQDDTPAGVERALRGAHERLVFVIDPEMPVLNRANTLQSTHG